MLTFLVAAYFFYALKYIKAIFEVIQVELSIFFSEQIKILKHFLFLR
jgi:hypothetical protein